MTKYTYGVWMSALAAAVIFGFNVNIVTGVASMFLVWGIAYMITGMVESVLKIVIAHFGQ